LFRPLHSHKNIGRQKSRVIWANVIEARTNNLGAGILHFFGYDLGRASPYRASAIYPLNPLCQGYNP